LPTKNKQEEILKTLLISIVSVLFFFVSMSIANESTMNIFRGTLSGEVYQGYFEGECGIYAKDFNSKLEIVDVNGLQRELFTKKIDSIEVSNSKIGSQVIVSIGNKIIKGKFECRTYLVTDTGRIDLTEIRKDTKINLVRVKK
jgi:hypothetical protein